MVYLIGGSSHVGKTLLAQKLMERYGIPYVSLDHLKMAFIRTGKTTLSVEDDYEMRYFLWPFVAEWVKTAIENNQNLILEGCYIPDSWQESFDESYLSQIRCVFLVMSEEYLRSHFSDVADYANVIERRKDDHLDLERLIACSKGFKEDCIAADIPYCEITDVFDLEWITDRIAAVLELSNTKHGSKKES